MMKHSGKARRSAGKMLLWTFILVAVILAFGWLAKIIGSIIVCISAGLVVLWILFALFTLYFFRDPEARVPMGSRFGGVAGTWQGGRD